MESRPTARTTTITTSVIKWRSRDSGSQANKSSRWCSSRCTLRASSRYSSLLIWKTTPLTRSSRAETPMLSWSSSMRIRLITSEGSSRRSGATYPTISSHSTTLPHSRTRVPARMLSLLLTEFCLMSVGCHREVGMHKIMLGTSIKQVGSPTRRWQGVAPGRPRATQTYATSKILSRLVKKWRAFTPQVIFKCWIRPIIIVQGCNRLLILPIPAPQVCPSYKM